MIVTLTLHIVTEQKFSYHQEQEWTWFLTCLFVFVINDPSVLGDCLILLKKQDKFNYG